NYNIIGLDNLNDYYDVSLKNSRLSILKEFKNFKFNLCDISDKKKVQSIFRNNEIDVVVNLAAQAGVRHSIEKPDGYIESNIVGFFNILEACRNNKISHLLYASSSSVYGMNKKVPFSTEDFVDNPVSLYAATKKSNELMAYRYSHLYKIPATGLRFFTVYGPFGRPDMAYYKFTKAILENKSIDVYNNGDMLRDFTYID
ncbi:MAG: NAD-dependent epimerase/dehydratase family protein, partial [bacterium]|nr:NAD-dependent epimerase/dehydratase family protein [bacterium]